MIKKNTFSVEDYPMSLEQNRAFKSHVLCFICGHEEREHVIPRGEEKRACCYCSSIQYCSSHLADSEHSIEGCCCENEQRCDSCSMHRQINQDQECLCVDFKIKQEVSTPIRSLTGVFKSPGQQKTSVELVEKILVIKSELFKRRLKVLVHNNYGIWCARALDIQFIVTGQSSKEVKDLFAVEINLRAKDMASMALFRDLDFSSFREIRWRRFAETAMSDEIKLDDSFEFEGEKIEYFPFDGVTFFLVTNDRRVGIVL